MSDNSDKCLECLELSAITSFQTQTLVKLFSSFMYKIQCYVIAKDQLLLPYVVSIKLILKLLNTLCICKYPVVKLLQPGGITLRIWMSFSRECTSTTSDRGSCVWSQKTHYSSCKTPGNTHTCCGLDNPIVFYFLSTSIWVAIAHYIKSYFQSLTIMWDIFKDIIMSINDSASDSFIINICCTKQISIYLTYFDRHFILSLIN